MKKNKQDRVQETLDHIQKDRIIPDDPWFYSRLMSRIEGEKEPSHRMGSFSVVMLRLRPILAMILLMIGIAGGISLGKVISTPANLNEPANTVFQLEEDANAAFFSEISGSSFEQILLMK